MIAHAPLLRKDPVTDTWVLVAEERALRPNEFARRQPAHRVATDCPFCPGNEDHTPPEVLRYPDAGSAEWRLRVVPNKYPAVHPGGHEVIIETPRHDAGIGEELFRAVRDRMLYWKRLDSRFAYVQFFKNSGPDAGASIEHPHSQLITLPIVPKRVNDELEGARKHFDQFRSCLFCHLIAEERRLGLRVIFETDETIAFMPWAARFEFETWFLPKVHASHFEDADPATLAAVTRTVKAVLSMLDEAAGQPAYNLILHTAPVQTGDLSHYHWHLELLPRISGVAGFEWATGYFINALPPEKAADLLLRCGLR